MLKMAIALVASVFVFASNAYSQQLPSTNLKVVGSHGILNLYKNFEKPFWTETLKKKSNGAITVDITPFNEMGLKGNEILRLLRLNVIDFGNMILGHVAADDPRNEAIDLPGLATDVETARAVSKAYQPVYDEYYRKQFGLKVLGIWAYPAQVLFCRTEIKDLSDIKGKKVRVGNRALSQLMQELGAVGVTLSSNETVPALQNGAVDCAITGSLSANAAKWYEVTTHLYPLPFGWAQTMLAANLKKWDGLDPKTREFLIAEIALLEDRVWKGVEEETTQGINCNIGVGTCTLGTKGHMTLVKVTDKDKALIKNAVTKIIVPQWAARCPGDCAKSWNETVGRIVGVTAPIK